MDIKVPGLKQDIKLGDGVKAVTDKLGIRQCGGCAKRQEILNRIKFKGTTPEPEPEPAKNLAAKSRVSPWATVEYPDIAEGWRVLDSCNSASLYTDGSSYIVISVVDNKYKRAHSDCCSESRAREVLKARCL